MAIKDDILTTKPAQQQQVAKKNMPSVTPVAQRIKADVAMRPNAHLQQPTEQVIPKRSDAEVIDEIAQRRTGYTPQTKEEEAREKKRQKVEQLFRSIGEGISSVANLHYAIKGAPSVYDPKDSLTAANQARWDKYYKEREAKRMRYQQELDKLWKEHKEEKRLEEEREYQRGRDKAADARQARAEDRMERQFQWQQEQAAATAKRATEEADKQRKHNAEQNAANRKNQRDIAEGRAAERAFGKPIVFSDQDGNQASIYQNVWKGSMQQVFDMLVDGKVGLGPMDSEVTYKQRMKTMTAKEKEDFVKQNWDKSPESKRFMMALSNINPSSMYDSSLAEELLYDNMIAWDPSMPNP